MQAAKGRHKHNTSASRALFRLHRRIAAASSIRCIGSLLPIMKPVMRIPKRPTVFRNQLLSDECQNQPSKVARPAWWCRMLYVSKGARSPSACQLAALRHLATILGMPYLTVRFKGKRLYRTHLIEGEECIAGRSLEVPPDNLNTNRFHGSTVAFSKDEAKTGWSKILVRSMACALMPVRNLKVRNRLAKVKSSKLATAA